MNLHYLLIIPLFIAGLAVGCAQQERPTGDLGVLSDYATDAGQTFNVRSVFRVNSQDNILQVVVEGHQYVVYDGWRGGGIVHSESCLHASHPGMGEIY